MYLMRPFPPLNALRAFEAAARHLSMSAAAAELNVTPAAVSHQVKGLEDYLAIKLFHRLQRGLALTDAGEAYLPGLQEGFHKIRQATEAVFEQEVGGPLTVSTTPTFAAKWLVHRIEAFTQEHPEIQVLISASTSYVGFSPEEGDVGIRFGSNNFPGCRVVKLFEEEVFPVCAPMLLEGENPIREPADLLHHTLLHHVQHEIDKSYPSWATWLRSYGLKVDGDLPGPHISPHWMLLEAAAAGQGVAMAKATVVEADLVSGRLVRLFDDAVHVGQAYWLIAPEETADKPKIRTFRDWLVEEARLHSEMHAKLDQEYQEKRAAERAGAA